MASLLRPDLRVTYKPFIAPLNKIRFSWSKTISHIRELLEERLQEVKLGGWDQSFTFHIYLSLMASNTFYMAAVQSLNVEICCHCI